MSFPLYIARRYTISFSKNTAVNIITGIATLGILVSTAALFVIMSVFSGLRDFSLSFANATDPDMKVFPASGKSITITPQQAKALAALKDVTAYSYVAEERVLFYFDGKEQVAYLKGVDSTYTKVTSITNPKTLLGGQWLHPYTGQVVVGAGIYNKLSLGLFDLARALEVFVPKAGEGTIDSEEEGFNKEELMVMGVYSVNEDIDNKYVFCSLDLAQRLLEFKKGECSAIELKMAPAAKESSVRNELQAIFKTTITTKNRAQLNDSLYKMLNAENLVTYLFCSLVVVMTLFCLAGALIMLILDKKENIITLYNLGAEVGSLRRIFFLQGIFITAIGAIAGLALGIGIVVAQQQQSLIMITPTMPYPTALTATNVLIVLATIFVLGIGASRIAAGRVNKTLLEE